MALSSRILAELMMVLEHDAVITKFDILSSPIRLDVTNSKTSSTFELSNADVQVNSEEGWGPSNSILDVKLENSKIEIHMQSGLKIQIS